jgi:hypothetical protein
VLSRKSSIYPLMVPVELQLIDRDCDSPMSLVNMTFDWIKKEWADEVDFVIWTGDNAR